MRLALASLGGVEAVLQPDEKSFIQFRHSFFELRIPAFIPFGIKAGRVNCALTRCHITVAAWQATSRLAPLPPRPLRTFPLCNPYFPVRRGRRSRGADPSSFTAGVCIFIATRKRPVRVDSDHAVNVSTTRALEARQEKDKWGGGPGGWGMSQKETRGGGGSWRMECAEGEGSELAAQVLGLSVVVIKGWSTCDRTL